nr:reverse transcriptase domain-containing protein [Tanacetum cinerariifolium]
MEEMMITTTTFIRGVAAAASKKKDHVSWKPQDQSKRHTSDKRSGFRSHSREGKGSNWFTLLTRTSKEILAAEARRDQSKTGKNETAVKDKPMTIYMVQSWQRTVKQKAEMGRRMIHRMYIDGGSSMEILYEHCFNQLRPEVKSQMVPATTLLTDFSGETIWPLGQLRLLMIIGDATHSTKAWMNFMIVKSLSPYNGIIGRPRLKAIQTVPSTVHGMLKFLVKGGIVTICSTILIPTECALVITSSVIPREERTCPANFKVALHPDFPDQKVVIGGTLFDKGRTELYSVLKKNLDVFAWQPSDMTRVPRSVAEHRLNIREGYLPVRQKKRGQAPERAKAIQAKVQKLLAVACRFHGSKQGLSAGLLPLARNQLESRISLRLPLQVIFRSLQRLPPNTAGRSRRREDNFPHRTKVKGQILVDFLIEIPGDVSQAVPVVETQEEPWMLFTDGSSCVDGSGVGLILTSPEGVEFTYVLRFQFTASNNEAEYEALVAGLRITARMRVKNVQVSVDSKLVANQVLETYVAKEDNMIKYLEIVKGLVSGFTTFSISQVSRSKNKKVDALSKITSTSFAHLSKQVLVKVLENKSIKEKEVAAVMEEDGPTWMAQLVDYLKGGVLPRDKKDARKLRLKARQYELIEGVLYRRSFLTPWLRCVGPLQAEYVMREIHEGSCSMHAGPRSVVAKSIRLGYYWPTMHKDACDMIRKCSDCQIHRPFPKGSGKVNFLIVVMDYFTKWIEAKAVASITGEQLDDFVYRSNDASHAVAGRKLGPKWEGPYEVIEALGNGAYKLRSTDGTILPIT